MDLSDFFRIFGVMLYWTPTLAEVSYEFNSVGPSVPLFICNANSQKDRKSP